jgi:hypothetical protein
MYTTANYNEYVDTINTEKGTISCAECTNPIQMIEENRVPAGNLALYICTECREYFDLPNVHEYKLSKENNLSPADLFYHLRKKKKLRLSDLAERWSFSLRHISNIAKNPSQLHLDALKSVPSR